MKDPDISEVLAIRAALLPRGDAMQAWVTLMSRTPWMELPEPAERCLAPIAVNLNCQSKFQGRSVEEIPNAARLAGVYRSTWSSNIIRIRAMDSFLEAIEERAIDYRVLKGTAICALTDRWGMRRMGDMDLAVSTAHAATSVAVLRQLGFWPRFFRKIDNVQPPQASCWESPDGHILDLHVGDTRRKRPTVIDFMFTREPNWVTSQGRSWPLPTSELMAVHAASHARMGAAVSDQVQALLDLAYLLPLTDPAVLEKVARSLRVANSLAYLQRELSAIIGRPLNIVGSSRSEPLTAAIARTAADLARFPAVVKERAPGQAVTSEQKIRSRIYRTWRRAGQLRPVERLIARTLGGFLQGGALDTPLDRRRKVEVPTQLHGRPIELRITCADPYARLIFVDGVSHGVLEQSTTIRVQRAPRSMEVSMRLLGEPPSITLAPIDVAVVEPVEASTWT
jgi:hypothetical protein